MPLTMNACFIGTPTFPIDQGVGVCRE